MKQLLLLAVFSVFSLGLSAQVYVDIDAADGGDGTTWATAYNDLNAALLVADAGSSVWIADGTYVTPDSVSFFIDKELTVLGGFNGTETDASAADPDANVTILSGDVAGNDGMAYDSLAGLDNNRVLFITDTSSVASQYTVTLDGLTISNGALTGNFDGEVDPSIVPFSGGGIISFARLNASRLTFSRNRANFGSDIAVVGFTAAESVLDDISIVDGYVSTNRSLYFNGADNVTVQNSDFEFDASATRQSGIIQAAFTNGFTLENCDFSDINTDFSGAAFRSDECDDVTVRNCTFENLTASIGGAMLHNQADNFVSDSDVSDAEDFVFDGIVIEDCSVGAGSRGAAMWMDQVNFTIRNSIISDNTAGEIGGAIYFQSGDDREYFHVIEDSRIADNLDNGAGGFLCALMFEGSSLNTEWINTEFEDNESSGGGQGGVAYIQGPNDLIVRDCEFEGNVAQTGSTFITRNGPNRLEVYNSDFESNGSTTASSQGGAFTAYLDDGSPGIIVDSCTFSNNAITAIPGSFGAGGAILVLAGDTDDIPMTITNSRFENNAAADGRLGGAIFTFAGMDVDIADTDFLSNSAGSSGGAICFQVGESTRDTVGTDITVTLHPFSADFESSKFIGNTAGTQGGAVATFTAGANFTNCVFVNNQLDSGEDGVSGGAIILNGNSPGLNEDGTIDEIGSLEINSFFIHNTFVGNTKGGNDAAVGDDIALFQPGDTADDDVNSMTVTLLNNAFLNVTDSPGVEIEPGGAAATIIPVGDVSIVSLGGNFYNSEIAPDTEDATMGGDDDIVDDNFGQEFENVFVDIDDDEGEGINVDLFIPGNLEDNPLINNGVRNELVPDEDIRGNPRSVAPDIGAYEADLAAVSTDEPIANSGLDISIFPNPTANFVNIRNEESSVNEFQVSLSDVNGRILSYRTFSATNNELDLSQLATGVYHLRLTVNGKVYSEQIVKQ